MTYCPLIKADCLKDKCEWWTKMAVRCSVLIVAEVMFDGIQQVEVVK